MRLSRLLPCVVVGGLIGVSVFGQSEEEPGPYRAPEGEVAEEAPAPSDRGASSTAENVAREEQELRKQYLKLIEQKTNLMDRSELREAISRTERDIDELKATEKLLEARQLLLELVKSHPETKAAHAARKMLRADDDHRPVIDTFQPQTLPQPYQAPPRATAGEEEFAPFPQGGTYEPTRPKRNTR